MFSKKTLLILSSLSINLLALPTGERVKAGDAAFCSEENGLAITTSDKAIIEYQDFQIGHGESVRFIQPNSRSCVLNRVIGGKESEILGALSGNGQIFLVNPKGVYFGPNATVNAASFLATSLSIKDEDFLADSFHFDLEPGATGSIINEGIIQTDGFAALFAPTVKNLGTISARVGKVFVGSAEAVTLDFLGDGLIEFRVQGELEKALIENYGKIESMQGDVLISVKSARKVVQSVINTDGIEPAVQIEESEGVIRLLGQSEIAARNAKLEAETIEQRGRIDVSNAEIGSIGGKAELFADRIELIGAQIDASGDGGGGCVLIGGDYQGKGENIRNATFTNMDKSSEIRADAYTEGSGGKVILWSDETTLFDGKIFARGGEERGDGGLVETSGKIDLGVETGFVDTSAPQGKYGTWLLDPGLILIAGGGGDSIASASSPFCSDGTTRLISGATLNAAASNISLCAQAAAGSQIQVSDVISLSNAGITLSLTAGSSAGGSILLQQPITTKGGAISFNGVVVFAGASITLDTTGSGVFPAGANISFSNTVTGGSAGSNSVTLTTGGGAVTFNNAVGTPNRLGALSVTSATNSVIFWGNVSANSVSLSSLNAVPANLFNSIVIDTSAANGAISLGGVVNGLGSGKNLTLTAGTGAVTFSAAVGNFTPVGALSITSASSATIATGITAGSVSIASGIPVTFTGAAVINTSAANGAISFGGTVNGNTAGGQNLTLTAGSGAVTFSNTVGASTRLAAMSVTSASGVSIANNITANSFSIASSIPATLTGSSTITTSAANGAISFGGTVNGTSAGAQNLTLTAGSGAVTFSGAVGNSTRLAAISVTSASGASIGGSITANSFSIASAIPATLAGSSTITTSAANGAISFGGTINGTSAGSQSLTLTAGSGAVTFGATVGGTTRLGPLSVTSASGVSITGNITANSFSISASIPMTFLNNITFNTSAANGNISLGGTIDGNSAGLQSLALNAGTGAITLSGNIGTTVRLNGMLISSASGGTVSLSGNVTANSFQITNNVALTLGNSIQINTSTSGGAISFGGTINGTSNGTQGLTLTAGSGAVTFSGAVGNSIRLAAMSVTSASSVSIGSNITANSFSIASSIPATLTGNSTITTSAANGAISFGGTINGTVAGSQSLTLAAGVGGITFSGAVGGTVRLGPVLISSASGGSVSLAANVTANSFTITNNVGVTLGNAIAINTSASGGTISFGGPIDGTQNLTLTAGGGSITFSGPVGSINRLNVLTIASANNVTTAAINAASIVQSAGTGTTAFNGAINTNAVAGIDLTGNAFTFAGGVTTTASGPLLVASSGLFTLSSVANIGGAVTRTGAGTNSFSGASLISGGIVTLNGATTLTGSNSISTNNQNINIIGVVDGGFTFSIASGSGTVSVAAIGGTTRVAAAVSISSTSSITTAGIRAGSIVISGSTTAALTLTGAYDTNAASGIQITGNTINRSGSINTTTGGPCTFTNNGTLTSTGNMTVAGAITQNGAGAVSIQDALSTTNGAISFLRAITLTGDLSLNSSAGSGAITLSSTVAATTAGVESLTLVAGGGTVSLNGNIGATRLNAFQITSAGNLTAAGTINANTVSQLAGTGTSTFNGAITATAVGGVSLAGTAFTLNAGITTTAGPGPMTVTNSGLLTLDAAATLNIGTNFNQNGAGSVSIANSITAGGFIQFNGAMAASGTVSLDTSAADGNITLFNSLIGPGDVTLNAGTGGDIVFSVNAGVATPLGSLVFTNAHDITTANISAASIAQTDGQNTSTFQALTTSAIGGISLTGNIFSINGNLITTGSGPVSIDHAGLLTLTAGASTSITGAFSESSTAGTGTVTLSGTVLTVDTNLSFARPITLSGDTTLSTGVTAAGNILLSSTVDATSAGVQNLTLTAGTGDITLSSAAGGTTRLGAFVVTSCANLTGNGLRAASVDVTETGGTITTNGTLDTNTVLGITINAENVVRGGSILATNGGPVTVVFSGSSMTTAPMSTVNVGSLSITNSGSGGIDFGGSVTTTAGGVELHSAVHLLGPAVVDTSAAGASGVIHFYDTVRGTQNVTLTAGAGSIFFDGAVGDMGEPLNVLTIASANDVTTTSISAARIVQTTGTGTTTFGGAITTSGALGISINTASIVRGSSITTTGGGPLTFTIAPSGTLTSTAAGAITLDGAFTETGASSVSLAGSITTTNDDISFDSPITLAGAASFDTGSGIGNISVATIDGAETLSLTAGTGNITASGDLGSSTPLGAVTVNSSTTLSLQALSAESLNVVGSTTATFNGNLTTSGASGIQITAGAINTSGLITTTGGGGCTFTNSGTLTSTSNMSVDGAIIQNGAGPVSIQGTLATTNGAISILRAITLTSNLTLNSSAGPAAITLSSTVTATSAGVQSLTLIAGAGAVSLNGNIGATRLNALQITSVGTFAASGTINANTVTQLAGTGTSTFNGAITTNAVGGVSLTGTAFTFNAGVTTTTGSGPMSVTNSGLLTLGSTAPLVIGGTFTQSGAGTVSIGSNVTTSNAEISWAGAMTLTQDVICNSGVGAGNIVFANTINGPHCLTLQAGTGSVQLSAAVGGSSPLNCLAATGTSITQSSSVQTVTTIDYTGAIQLGGNQTTSNANITLTGNVALTGSVILNSGSGIGNISITGTVNGNASGRNFQCSAGTGDVTLSGAIGNTIACQNITLSGANITWANLGSASPGSSGTTSVTATNQLTFTGTTYNGRAQSYTAGTLIELSAGSAVTITSANFPITFNTAPVQLDVGSDLTINSNGGDITLGASPVSLQVLDMNTTNFTANCNTGDFFFTQIGDPSNPLDVVTLTATSFTPPPVLAPAMGANVYATSLIVNSPTITFLSGIITIVMPTTYSNPVVLIGDVTVNFDPCGPGTGDLIFDNTLDADGMVRTLLINACQNPVTFNGPVGSISPLESITIINPSDVNIFSTMNVGAFSETMGTGTTTINSAMTLLNSGGISISTDAITITSSITTQMGGPVALDNAGLLTLSGGLIDADGPFSQTGGPMSTGTVSIGQTIQTTNDTISFASPISLTGDLILDTSTVGASITLSSTVDGTANLSLTAGGGDIVLGGAIGGMMALNNITISSAHDVTATAISSASITQTAGTGTTTVPGAIATSAGINLTGSAFTLSGGISSGGALLIQNTGALSLSGGVSVGGVLTQSNTGGVALGGSFAADGAISFASATSLASATSFNTTANNTNITFSSTINGGQNLSFNLGSGNLFLNGNIGTTTPVGVFTITAAQNVTAAAISAGTITQTAGSGTSSFGSLTTSLVGGISLTGTAISINGNLITTNLGVVTIDNAGALALIAGASTSITGAFAQTGMGSVSLQGTLLTINQNVSFLRAVSLTGTTSISTSSGIGTITFSSTLNGNFNLSLLAGTGNIVFGPSIGSPTALQTLTVQSCTNITYPTTSASSLVQNASSGTTTLSSPITTTGGGGISIAGTLITQTSSLSSNSSGTTSIINSGVFSMGGTINASGGFAQSGGGSVQLNGPIATTNTNISFADPITLTGSSSLNTGVGAGNIVLSNTVNGNNALSLTAGTGSITLGANIGLITPIGALTIVSGLSNSTQAISALSILQQSGSTTFGALTTSGASGINLQVSTATLSGNVTTGGTGALSIQNTGIAVLSGSTFSIAGAVTQSGLGSVTLSSAITAGGNIQIAGATTVSLNPSLNTAAAGADITFLSTINGGGNLTFNAGMMGDVSVTGAIGGTARLGNVVFTNASTITVTSITAASVTQTNAGAATYLNLDTNGVGGIQLSGGDISVTGNLITAITQPCTIAHTGLLILNAGASSLTGPFTESGLSGTVNLSGSLHASNANVSFANPITLTGAATINSNDGGDILISDTVDGAFDLVYTAGTGTITLAAAIGGTTPVNSLTITTAGTVSAQQISAGKILQQAGSVLTTFHGPLATTFPEGIVLTGTGFAFEMGVTTLGAGPVSITNSGSLSIPATASFTLDGLFSQAGSGPVSLCTTITTTADPISFAGPVTLCGNTVLNTGAGAGTITFSNTVTGTSAGMQSLTLIADTGNVVLSGAVGATRLNALTISSATNVTASGSINANTLTQSAGSGLSIFEAISTNNVGGISLTGNGFTLQGPITTAGGGPLAIANSSTLTLFPSSLPSMTFSLTGSFTQTGASTTNMGNLTLNTNGNLIQFSGPIQLTGSTSLNSANGNITLSEDVNGDFALSIAAGSGDVSIPMTISDITALESLTVISAHDITLGSVGSSSSIMEGSLSLTASNLITLSDLFYAAHSQQYSAGTSTDFTQPGMVTLLSSGGSISFGPILAPSGTVNLGANTDLMVTTQGGDFAFDIINGTTFENITIDTGAGQALLGSLPNLGTINSLMVNGGLVLLNGPMDVDNASLVSATSIFNANGQVDLTAQHDTFFNALTGDVGTIANPILVHTLGQIIAGAGAINLASFDGSSIDNTVQPYPPNPPCNIYFNGVQIQSCTLPPPPPPPPSPPAPPSPPSPPSPPPPPTPSNVKGSRLFAVQGMYDSQFNLASNYYFFTYLLDDRYLVRSIPVFTR